MDQRIRLTGFKALKSRGNNPLHPDPDWPILFTRIGAKPTGPGATTLLFEKPKVAAKVARINQQNQWFKPWRYRATVIPSHVRMRARLRACVCVSLSFSGSKVAYITKSLFPKGNSRYFCRYFAATSAASQVARQVNPLKMLEKRGF